MRILAVYGSNTGNTKALMYFIKDYCKKVKHKFALINAKDITLDIDFLEYDLVILSSPTWGGITPTLQDDFASFWSNLNKNKINGNQFAIIGLGDIYYQAFCKAIDFLSDDIIKYKGKLLINSLAVPDVWSDHKETIQKWLEKLVK